jgi:hypothetical protein
MTKHVSPEIAGTELTGNDYVRPGNGRDDDATMVAVILKGDCAKAMKSSIKEPQKGRLRRLVELFIAIALIVGGVLFLIAWEHPLSIIWDDPVAIFWDAKTRVHEGGGRFWWMGLLLIAAGAFWIAEDWFGFGQARNYAAGSELPIEKKPVALDYDRDQRKQ